MGPLAAMRIDPAAAGDPRVDRGGHRSRLRVQTAPIPGAFRWVARCLRVTGWELDPCPPAPLRRRALLRAPCGATTREIHLSTTFAELGVPLKLTRALDELELTTPFPIQASTIGDALAGRDVCGKAPTGSGKTLAFSIPLAMRSAKAVPSRPTALVLVPTRELASQVRDTLQPLAQKMDRRVATVFGGTSINKDVTRLRKGVDILVACPGRLADLIRRGDCHLGDVGLVVLDEADRMADMGFLPEVIRLLDTTRDDRQTLLFSATLDGEVDKLVRRYQHDPATHSVTTPDEDQGEVRHLFFAAERPQRRDTTADVLRTLSPAIVFTRTKRGADRLSKQLTNAGISTAAIHGDRSQGQRERALARFHAGEVTALVATDVAARGIHVDDVAVVVHFDLPADPKDYVHRSGRTGRAGSDGVVLSFVGLEEGKDVADLQRGAGLPNGMHDQDMALLTSDGIPEPTRPVGPSNDRPSSRGNSRGGNQRRGRGASGGSGKAANRGGARSKANAAGAKARSGGGGKSGGNGGQRSTTGRNGNNTGGGAKRGGQSGGG
ncbi:MAG: DEAD/DEAH box helicase, partial [Nitriliruptoraceae bacterium]|nr:DEAD/DEAH box helicase [Nitriliruptoraceae bacterium]